MAYQINDDCIKCGVCASEYCQTAALSGGLFLHKKSAGPEIRNRQISMI